jgi:site-specific recombinase XerD
MTQASAMLSTLLETYALYRILQPKTVVVFKTALRNFQLFLGHEPTIADLTTETLLKHRAWCLGKISAVSYNSYRRQLYSLTKFAIDEQGLLQSNPFKKVGPAPEMKRLPKVMSSHVVEKVRTTLELQPISESDEESLAPRWFWRAVCETLNTTGIRRRQLIGMIWDDVNFSDNTILLRAETSKTRREWRIPLPNKLRPLLLELQEKTRQVNPGMKGSDQLFRRPIFHPNKRFETDVMNESHVSAFFKRLQRATKEKVSPHRFRHTMSTRIVNKGGNIKNAQHILGHTDERTTLGYLHPDMDSIRALMDR